MVLNILTPVVLAASIFSVDAVPGHNETDDPTMNIVEVAASSAQFRTLVQAIEAAGLVETLAGEGPFTVFAPTDEAFAAVPAEALAALLADTDALTAVLTYHVVPGELPASQVLSTSALTTVNGAEASISIGEDGLPRIDDAVITATDIEAKNGIIHVIDRVIFPQ
jgi:uncharacterized surface protein with fasciclin (FAS1) repeats